MQRIKEAESLSRHTVLLIAAAEGFEGLPPSIRRCFSHEIRMGPLTEEQRADILSQALQSVSQLLNNVGKEICPSLLFFLFFASICLSQIYD